jgi:hypothetical protein
MKILVEAYILKGQIAISLNDYEGAIEAFDEALYLNSSPDPNLLLWSGYAHFLVAEYQLTGKKNKTEQGKKIALCISKLENARKLMLEERDKTKEDEVFTYVRYFLGYLYFKANDLFSAKEILIECINTRSSNLSNDEKIIREEAKDFLTYIWEQRIKPSFWRWWWYSPNLKDEKRILFIAISGLITWAFFNIGLCFPLFHIIYIEGTTLQVLFVLTLVAILLIPNIQKFRAKEYEVELKSAPTDFNISTSKLGSIVHLAAAAYNTPNYNLGDLYGPQSGSNTPRNNNLSL